MIQNAGKATLHVTKHGILNFFWFYIQASKIYWLNELNYFENKNLLRIKVFYQTCIG